VSENAVRLKTVARNPVVKSDGLERPFIALEDIESGTARLLIDEPRLKQADDSICHEPRDVLFGKLRPYLAKCYLAEQSATATSELMVLRPGQMVEPRFLLYVTSSRPWIEWAVATSYGSKMPRTSWDAMAEYRLWLPPIGEQRRIADFLDVETTRIDRVMTAHDEVRSRLVERRSAKAKELVVGGEHVRRQRSGLPWVNAIPESWTSTRINFVARMGSGHTPSRSNPEWWGDCTIPWITTGEVADLRDDRREMIYETRERISRIGVANSSAEVHPAGTVVLSRTASAGFSGVMGSDMATSQDFVTWTCGSRLDPFYLLWCLRAMRQDLLGRLATGSTHKTIYVPDLQALRIPLPSISEQRKIVEKVRRSNDLTDRLLDSIDQQDLRLAERRHALITAAVTGQIDVTTARRADV
jgi:type I restriction enzyme S subunit